MKIFIIGSLASSLQNFRGALIENIRSLGHSVHAVAPNLFDDKQTYQWLKEKGVTCHQIPLSRTGLSPFLDLVTLVQLYRVIKQEKPDIVLCYTIKPIIWGMLASWLAKVPRRFALITGLGYAFTDEKDRGRIIVRVLAQYLYRAALQCANIVAFQNPDDFNVFSKIGMLSRETKTAIVNGSGVDTVNFSLAPFPKGTPHFLLIARLLGDKGIREFAAAANTIRTSGVKAEFHLVGPIDTNPNSLSEETVKKWHRLGIINWHGGVSDVRPFIANSHVYVLPSYREGTPRTVLEAMSMGRPVVTTDAPGCRETVEVGVNGFLVPIRDADALANAMAKFIKSPGLITKMGIQSRRIVEEKYDVRLVNAEMMRLIFT